jgi:hypothetical protein
MFFKARYFSPAVGRFLSADTIVPLPGNPQQFNRYAYVSNNPVNRIDPSGHKECEKSTEVGCQGASDRERREAQACADIPGWCDPNTSGVSALLEIIGSVLLEPVDWVLSARDCLGGDCSGVLLGLIPFVPGSARKIINGFDAGGDVARAAKLYGQMPGEEVEFLSDVSRQYDCSFIVCGRRSETDLGLSNREKVVREYGEGVGDPDGIVPGWRAKISTGKNEFDYFVRGGDLPEGAQNALRARYGDDLEFDNWNRFDGYRGRDPGGIVFDRGSVRRNHYERWQVEEVP